MSLTLQILGMLCILFSFNLVHVFPLQSKHKLQKDKRTQLMPHNPGPRPCWSPRPCHWFIKFSLLVSKNQIFSCGAVFPENCLNNQYIWKPQANSAGCNSRRIKVYLEDPPKKMKPWLNSLSLVFDIILIYRWLNWNLQHCHQFKNIWHSAEATFNTNEQQLSFGVCVLSCIWLFVDCSLTDSSVHAILQAITEWVAIFYPGDCPNHGIKPTSPTSPTWVY